MGLSIAQQTLLEQRITNDGPSTAVAYLLWLFLGFFSGHRFYLKRTGSAIAQMLLNFILIGLIWTLIDVFLVGGMVREERDKLRNRYATDMLMHS